MNQGEVAAGEDFERREPEGVEMRYQRLELLCSLLIETEYCKSKRRIKARRGDVLGADIVAEVQSLSRRCSPASNVSGYECGVR
jgi:hypothetical protein